MFLFLFSATDDIPHADEIRTLVKDIWDLRIAKLRSSIDTFVKSEATHAKVLLKIFIIPPANEFAGVYSDPYVCPFVRSSVHPSVLPSLPISNPLLL